jgi:hypothetical protein
VAQLRQLEDENRTFKQVVADLTVDNRAVKDMAAKPGDAHGLTCHRGLCATDPLTCSPRFGLGDIRKPACPGLAQMLTPTPLNVGERLEVPHYLPQ